MAPITKSLFIRYLNSSCFLFFATYNLISWASTEETVLISKQEFANLLQEPELDDHYLGNATEEELQAIRGINSKKSTTILIYIAADNDLYPFAWKNIKQMEMIGSNENVNVLVQLNAPGNSTPTKRYMISNGKRLLIPASGNLSPSQKLNSGHPQTLIDAAAWAMQNYPADNLVLNLWDHGSGVYDPGVGRIRNTLDMFHFNEETRQLVLDRTVDYTSFMDDEVSAEESRQNGRGICFDETFKSYMTNQDLKYALSEIQNKVLQGKKISILWFDACLMAMLEIANIAKDHVDYLVASEDVEYASGSNYELVLRPFVHKALSPQELACHIVACYEKAYQHITKDYTQSAIDLSLMQQLETNVNLVAQQILWILQNQKNNSMTKILQQCKSRPLCTCFEEPTYIDLHNFYMNLQAALLNINLNNPSAESAVKLALAKSLDQGINIINSAVIANKVGSNLQKARGISIYFPERGMFPSYPRCNFAQTNKWGVMISQYLLSKK